MKTEELNEYIFTKLIMDIAQSFWQKRVAVMRSLAKSDGEIEEIRNTPLTDEDIQNAIILLEKRRNSVSSIMKEIHPDVLAPS